jgi:hypothetical protein
MEPWLEAFARVVLQRGASTAHDLKTPLNVAVLNLELLRMRMAKIADDSIDDQAKAYAASIEAELRRMARIVDAYFLFASPPNDEGEPVVLDLAPLCRQAAKAAGFKLGLAPLLACVHESRIQEMLSMFFDGVKRVLKADGCEVSADCAGERLEVIARGSPEDAAFELTKIFKFYYTDALGNPDLSLATARLIAETYGGQLKATKEHDKVTINLSLPRVIR